MGHQKHKRREINRNLRFSELVEFVAASPGAAKAARFVLEAHGYRLGKVPQMRRYAVVESGERVVVSWLETNAERYAQ